jgi:alcohol dehydrogenase class IV
MSCCHHYFVPGQGGDVRLHHRWLDDDLRRRIARRAGDQAKALGMTRVALFTDRHVRTLPPVTTVVESLRAAGSRLTIYDEVPVEPTDASFKAAARFAQEGRFDGFLSVGGGSVIDTCKAANLYCDVSGRIPHLHQRADRLAGKPVPGPVKPHIACPRRAAPGSRRPASRSSTCSR